MTTDPTMAVPGAAPPVCTDVTAAGGVPPSCPPRRVTFTVPGKPSPKARARTTRAGVTFTPKPTQLAEAKVLECYLAAYPNASWIPGPVAITIAAIFEPPASWSKKRRAAALAGDTKPTGRPDWDNIAKLVTDALNGVAYRDDSQIVDAHVTKDYGTYARCDVTIEASA